jgi:mannitol-1-phosphate 5-dehydrogenase
MKLQKLQSAFPTLVDYQKMQLILKKILIFGAGKIGRSFIGQLFSRSGYQVVFIDISLEIIDALNRENSYRVIVKSDNVDEVLEIDNVSGIHITDTTAIIQELIVADLVSTSVGKNGIPGIIPLLAEGLVKRRSLYPDQPLDVIIAENMHNADLYFRAELIKHLPADFPVDVYVGLIETSIGKMVPIMPADGDGDGNILTVFAEPYNTLILDKKGFRSTIPEVEGLQTKENMKAWVDRKLFIHNFGHAAAAYAGNYYFPKMRYMYEVLDDPIVRRFAEEAMTQSADILLTLYPEEFTQKQLSDHIQELIARFCNRALGDTVFRVGCDLYRKLAGDDRLILPYRTGLKMKLPTDKIAEAISYSLFFRATGENQEAFPADEEFFNLLNDKGVFYILKEVSKIEDIEADQILKVYSELNTNNRVE